MSPVIFASCRDCPTYLASAETVCDLLLPAETTFHEKWLPAGTVETLGRKLNHRQSLQEAIHRTHQSRQEARGCRQSRRKPIMTDSLCRKHKLADLFIPCEDFQTR